jgi:phage-related minor tail protein
MSRESYKESVEKRKEKQVENLWSEVSKTKGLESIVKLREKLKEVEQRREKTRKYMEETEGNYNGLKKSIREFIRLQNAGRKAKR